MRKNKCYLKDLPRHPLKASRIVGNKVKWRCPRTLRKYYTLQLTRWQEIQNLKIFINSICGRDGSPGPADDEYRAALARRRLVVEQFRSGKF